MTTDDMRELNRDMRQINERLLVSAVHQQASNDALSSELKLNRAIAEAMQYSILWQKPEKQFNGLKVATFYEPAAGYALVGGDFFDAFKLPNQSIMLMVGDVVGKGLKAATRTVEVTFALRAFAQDYQEPAAALARLNAFICDFHHDDDDEIDNALIVLSLVVVNPVTGAMQMASAGAERPLILHPSGEASEVVVEGLMLGIDRTAQYASTDMCLELGDTLLMTTDGISEARNGPNFFGYERLIETARRANSPGTPYDIGNAILEEARQYTGGRITDDICLLLARRTD